MTASKPSAATAPQPFAGFDRQTILAGELEGAMARGEVGIAFQPQFSCATNAMTGAEALARWNHAPAPVGAGELLSVAASSGQSARLTRHVLAASLSQACEWPHDLRLSVNVTAADMAAPSFAENFLEQVARSGFNPARLTVEITEQTPILDLPRAARDLQALSEHQICIALDDFGAGFCNFEYLKVLPVDYLKLDCSMVKGIAHNPRDLAVLRAIMEMARALDMAVVAEGIETEAQRDTVIQEGCATWQGFLGAEPLDPGEFRTRASGQGS